MIILGIDPGLSGALALYDVDHKLVSWVADIPTYDIKGKRHLNYAALNAFLFEISEQPIDYAVLERVHSMPGQGVASSFKFGEVLGALQAMLTAYGVAVKLVEPRVWKKAMGLNSPDKDLSRQMVTRLLPFAAHHVERKKDDGRAEAILLAMYGASL